MNIREIGILGAGAVGASLAHQLFTKTPPIPVSLIADGPRADRYRRDGIRVNGDLIRPAVVDSGKFDLILVATKSYHLDEALKLLDRNLGDGTLLMSMLNGIDSEEILGQRYGHERVVPAMILGIDALRESDGIRYMNRGVIHFGANPQVEDQRATIDNLVSWFATSGLGFELSDDIDRTLWRKFMINVGANQVSAVHRATYEGLRSDPVVRERMKNAMAEVVALSEAEGTGLAPSDIDAWVDLLMTLNPDGKTSMLQDVEAGRPTEVDLFAGTVVKLGQKHGIAVPVNERLLQELSGD